MANDPSGRRPGVDFGRLGSTLSIVLIGLGLLIIAVGANGIRSNDTVIEQMPYILTGGVLGMAFVVFGSAYMIVQNSRQDVTRLEAKLDELVDAVAAGSGSSGPRSSVPENLAGLVVAGSASYHVPGCRLVDGREAVRYLTPDEARGEDLKACRVCQPESAERTNVTVR